MLENTFLDFLILCQRILYQLIYVFFPELLLALLVLIYWDY